MAGFCRGYRGRQRCGTSDHVTFTCDLMNSKKGITISMWVWIIAGVLIGVTVFTVAYFNIWQLTGQAHKQEVKDTFLTLRSEIERACMNAEGYKKPNMMFNLYMTRAIYLSEGIRPPDPKVSKLISQGNLSSGDYICLSYRENDYECSQLPCEANMTYIGRPLKGSDMYELGVSDENFEFEVTVEKVEMGKVNVSARHIP